ncbi:unnamed protein product, partial [Prorocentrum cordatum]
MAAARAAARPVRPAVARCCAGAPLPAGPAAAPGGPEGGGLPPEAWLAELGRRLPALRVRAVPRAAQEGPALVLLGVRHDCGECARQVPVAVAALRPDRVGLELCDRRLRRLLPRGLAACAALPPAEQHSLQERLSHGAEQLAAALAAARLGVPAAPCDRDVRETEDRLLARLEPEVLVAGACAALGVPRVGTAAAWLATAWQLRRLCRGGAASAEAPRLGALPAALREELVGLARALACDARLPPAERRRRRAAQGGGGGRAGRRGGGRGGRAGGRRARVPGRG